jgi:carnitine 3-dehydrogenase
MVEVIGGALTTQKNIKIVCDFYDSIFMKPVHLKKEIDAFVADRLLEAIWREALWLIKDGICTTQELDDIVKYGFGLRYAQMGVFETYRIAGGDGGMRKHLENFGPCLKWPWTKLTDVPDLNEDLIELIVSQSDQQSKGKSIQQLEELRDDNLVEIQKGLKSNNSGVGKLLNEADKALKRRSHTETN